MQLSSVFLTNYFIEELVITLLKSCTYNTFYCELIYLIFLKYIKSHIKCTHSISIYLTECL